MTLVFGVFFIGSGLSKARRRDAFRSALRQYGLWARTTRTVALAWIAVEVLVGVWAVASPAYQLTPLLGALGVATGAVAQRVRQGAGHDCGCSSRSHPISWRLLAKNLTIAAGAVWVAYATGGSPHATSAATAFLIGAALGAGSVGRRAAGAVRAAHS